MKYIKPQIEYNEILSEDILTESDTWGEILAGGKENGGNAWIGLDENKNPIIHGDAADFLG